jgi:hypothetical protein
VAELERQAREKEAQIALLLQMNRELTEGWAATNEGQK